jgi:hypothetical protein
MSYTADYESDEWQTRLLVRKIALYRGNRSCRIVIRIWSCAPDRARHQDELTDLLS